MVAISNREDMALFQRGKELNKYLLNDVFGGLSVDLENLFFI
jgi:hypothetical protein